MLNVAFSRRLAIVAGALLPVLETIRRRHEFPGPIATWDSWLDDYLIGAFLLFAAWKTRPRLGLDAAFVTRQSSLLAAAWGFACAFGVMSLLSQIHPWLDTSSPNFGNSDPSGLSHAAMVAIKGGLLALGVLGLIGSVRGSNR